MSETAEFKMTSKDDIIHNVQANHLWLNAFHCINPSKEYCEQIGQSVIEMLNRKENLLPDYYELDGCESEDTVRILHRMSKLTPVLYLSVNKS